MESSSSEYMSVYVTGRLSSDPSGQMESPKLAQAGQAPYHGFDSSPFRAGDFSGLTVDPSDGSFWAANVGVCMSTHSRAAMSCVRHATQFQRVQPIDFPSPDSSNYEIYTQTPCRCRQVAVLPVGFSLMLQFRHVIMQR
jgi:hypothetical protein